MIDITTLRAMATAGASVEVILAAVEAELMAEGARVQARRAKDAERKRRQRHAESHDVTRTERDISDTSAALNLSSPSLLVDSSKESIREVRTEVVEGQGNKKVSREAKKTHLSDDWKPNEKHYAKEKKFGHPSGYVDQKADDMRNWAKSKAIMRADWDATFHGFLRPKETVNGFGGPRPLQDDSKSISRAAGRLEEAARRGEFTFGPRPSLLPEPNENPVRLLSKG